MANLKVGVQFDASDLQKDIQKAVKDANTTIKGIKPETIKPQIEIPAGSIAALKAQLKELTAKRNVAIGIDLTNANKEIGEVKKSIRELETQGKTTGKFFAGNFMGNIQALGVLEVGKSLVAFGEQSREAFLKAEKASSQLTAALKNAGMTSKEYRDELDAQATALSELTAIDDDTISAIQAIAVNYGLTGKAQEDFVKGTLDFSVGTGKDAVTSAQRFGKALKDNVEVLDEQGNAVGKVGDVMNKFKGQAEEFGKSAGGAAQRAKNDFENFQESVGGFISGFGGKILSVVTAFAPLIAVSGLTTASFAAMWTAITGPIGLVVLAVAAVIGVFVLLYNKVDFIREFIDKFISDVVSQFHAVVDAVRGLFVDLDAEREADAEKEQADTKARQAADLLAVQAAEEKKNAELIKAHGVKAAAEKKAADEASAKRNVELERQAKEDRAFRLADRKKREAEAEAEGLKIGIAEQKGKETARNLAGDVEAQNIAAKQIEAEQLIGDARVAADQEINELIYQQRLTAINRQFDADGEAAVNNVEATAAAITKADNAAIAAKKKRDKDDLDATKKNETTKLTIKKTALDAELDAALQVSQGLQGLFGEQTAVAKAAAIATTTIQTYSAATAALSPPPVGLGPVFGPIMAAITIAAGFANIAKIAAVPLPSFAKGTDYFTGQGAQRGPTGGYIVEAHEGEAILTREENKRRRSDTSSLSAVTDAVRELNATMKAGISTDVRSHNITEVEVTATGRELKGVLHSEEKHTRNNSLG